MRTFFYEFVTGGGFLDAAASPCPHGSLLNEGKAMWRAVSRDLCDIDGNQVTTTRDARLTTTSRDLPGLEINRVSSGEEHASTFAQLADGADFAVIIAPEFDSLLLKQTRQLESSTCRLASANSAFVELCTNKTNTVCHLEDGGVRVPPGMELPPGDPLPRDFPYPAILKPIDGAGALGVVRIENADQSTTFDTAMRLERFMAGQSCSVSLLCGETCTISLPPMEQTWSSRGSYAYAGGKRILDHDLVTRATSLAQLAIAALPSTLGYIGIDLVLGSDPDGTDDYVIEVNPRFTTSYIGLREIATTNLAQALLEFARGGSPQVEFSDRFVEFLSDGTVR